MTGVREGREGKVEATREPGERVNPVREQVL
jgi:hypothetical protein